MRKYRILLHICCGICALEVIKELSKEFGEVVPYFYNPNIEPEEEYKKRLIFAQKAAEINNLRLIEGEYNNQDWRNFVAGLENEPEAGKRCELCFQYRLENSAKFAKQNNCNFFATTLAISPHKNARVINEIGQKLADKYQLKFLARNFKKEGGFKKTMELAKYYNFYRQNYCGCLFSKPKSWALASLKK